jgi:hypothetical protein
LELHQGLPQPGNNNPHHLIALQNRAQGYLLVGQPLQAAHDYQVVIQNSQRPGPELYGATVSAYIAAGSEYFPQAMDVVREGLARIPREISLTGMGTDISLARSNFNSAQALIDTLPEPVLGLLQWKIRSALLDCLAGRRELALQGFTAAAEDPSLARKTAALLPEQWLRKLAADPTPENCQLAALTLALGATRP